MSQEQEPQLPPDSPEPETDRRMADLAAFANGVAHDIRNPLSVIRTNVYLLRQGAAGQDPKVQRALERIEEQVKSALHLLNGIQAFDRSEHPSFQRVNLNELVRSLAESLTPPEGVELAVDLDEELPAVTGDPQLLDPALRGLVRNALESLPGKGTLHLRTRREGEAVQIIVQDDGPGMAPEVRSRAFEAFASTQRAHAGLGLTLVEKVARVHRGRALLHSAPGEGTTVVVEIPIE